MWDWNREGYILTAACRVLAFDSFMMFADWCCLTVEDDACNQPVGSQSRTEEDLSRLRRRLLLDQHRSPC